MVKIGFVDRYLDNWHSNHYPEYIELAAKLYGIDAKVTHAWAEIDNPDEYGMTTKIWCERYDCIACNSYEELIDRVDAIMVMCADDCLPHEELAYKALASGKPVYCDKTFASTLEAATRMFDRAQQYQTPVFTCSAQRFCMELLSYKQQVKEVVNYAASTGPGDMVNYSIHQYEMLQMLMGNGVKRCQAFKGGDMIHIVYQYDDGRICTFTQGKKQPFQLYASTEIEGSRDIAVTDYYMNFMNHMLHFFQDKKVPVTRADTLEIMTMQQAGRKAISHLGEWIEV